MNTFIYFQALLYPICGKCQKKKHPLILFYFIFFKVILNNFYCSPVHCYHHRVLATLTPNYFHVLFSFIKVHFLRIIGMAKACIPGRMDPNTQETFIWTEKKDMECMFSQTDQPLRFLILIVHLQYVYFYCIIGNKAKSLLPIYRVCIMLINALALESWHTLMDDRMWAFGTERCYCEYAPHWRTASVWRTSQNTWPDCLKNTWNNLTFLPMWSGVQMAAPSSPIRGYQRTRNVSSCLQTLRATPQTQTISPSPGVYVGNWTFTFLAGVTSAQSSDQHWQPWRYSSAWMHTFRDTGKKIVA